VRNKYVKGLGCALMHLVVVDQDSGVCSCRRRAVQDVLEQLLSVRRRPIFRTFDVAPFPLTQQLSEPATQLFVWRMILRA
jgi:hypothetical protein